MIQFTCYVHSTHISNTCCVRRRPTGSPRSYNGLSLIVVLLLLLLQQVSSTSSSDSCTITSLNQVDSDVLRSFSLLLKRLQPLHELYNVICEGATEEWPRVYEELMALGRIATSKIFNDFKDLLRLTIPREESRMSRQVRTKEECKKYDNISIETNLYNLVPQRHEIIINIEECKIIRQLPPDICKREEFKTESQTSRTTEIGTPVTTASITNETGTPVTTTSVNAETGTPMITTSVTTEIGTLVTDRSVTTETGAPLTTTNVTTETGRLITTTSVTTETGTPVTYPSVTTETGAPVTTTSVTKETVTPVTTTSVTKETGMPMTTTSVTKETGTPLTTTSVTKEIGTPVTTTSVTKETGIRVTTTSVTKETGTPVTTTSVTKETGTPVTTTSVTIETGAPVTTTSVTTETGTLMNTTSITTETGTPVTTSLTTETDTPVTTTSVTTETGTPVTPANVTKGTGTPVFTITIGTPSITTTTSSGTTVVNYTLNTEESNPTTEIPVSIEKCVTASVQVTANMKAMKKRIENIAKNISSATDVLIDCTNDMETLQQTEEYIMAMNDVMVNLSKQLQIFMKEAWPASSDRKVRKKRLFSGFSTYFNELKLITPHTHQGEPVHCPENHSSFSDSFAEVDVALTSLGEDPTNSDLADQLYCTGSHLADMAAKVMQGRKSGQEKEIEKANHAIVTKSIIDQVLKIIEEKEEENMNQQELLEKEIDELKKESNELEANLKELTFQLEQQEVDL